VSEGTPQPAIEPIFHFRRPELLEVLLVAIEYLLVTVENELRHERQGIGVYCVLGLKKQSVAGIVHVPRVRTDTG
jgi:hypothetical protein